MKGINLPNTILIGILLAVLLWGAEADDRQNETVNLTVNQSSSLDENMSANDSQVQSAIILGSGNRNAGKALRAGFLGKKAINDLDVYGNRSVHVIPPQDPAQWAFDISQRVGNVSRFDYSNSFKPLFSMNQYSRTKAVYQAPSNLSSRQVFSISGYPLIKIPGGMT